MGLPLFDPKLYGVFEKNFPNTTSICFHDFIYIISLSLLILLPFLFQSSIIQNILRLPLPYSQRTSRTCCFVCECTHTHWQTAQTPGSGLGSKAFNLGAVWEKCTVSEARRWIKKGQSFE